MAELKLRRLNELNQRLQEDLNRRRIPVSEASAESVISRPPFDYLMVGVFGRYILFETVADLIATQLDSIYRQRAQGLYGT